MKKITVDEFWNWFSSKSEFLMDIDNLEENESEILMNEFSEVLESYSEGMGFEIGPLTSQGREIVFSAEGDQDYFDDVIELCTNTPILDFWDIIAFKQPKGPKVKINFEGYSLNSKDVWFMPLENEDDLDYDLMGLRIALKGHKQDDEDQLIAVYSLIEEMIGEYDCATLIGYFDITELPQEPEKEGYIPLLQLQEYVDWHMNKIEGKADNK